MLQDPRPIRTLLQALQTVLHQTGIEFIPSQWAVQEAITRQHEQAELALLQAYLDACKIQYTLHAKVLPGEIQHLGLHCLAMKADGQAGLLQELLPTGQAFSWVVQVHPPVPGSTLQTTDEAPSGLFDFWRKMRNSTWLRNAFRFEKGSFRPVVYASLLINLLALAGPLFSLQVYDRIIPNQAYSSLAALLAGVLLCLFFEHVLKHARYKLMEMAATSIDTRCTSRLSEQLLKVRSHQAEPAMLLQHLRAFEQLRELITGMVLLAAIDLPFLALFIAVIGLIHPLFLLITSGIILATLLLVAYSHRSLAHLGVQQMKQVRESQTQWLDSLACLDNIQAHGVEQGHRSLLNRLQFKARLCGNEVRNQLFLINQRIHLLQQVGWLAVLATGVYLVIEKHLTVGGLIAVSMLTMRCFAPIQKLQGHLVHTHSAQASFEELDRFLGPATQAPPGRSALPELKHLEVKGASVSKPGSNTRQADKHEFMLRDIQLELPAGSRIGIIGPTGSGKTSLLKLLAGQLACNQGAVLVNHLSVEHYHPEEISSRVGYATQPPVLVKGSLLDNLRFMRSHIDTASCWATLDQLGLRQWVEAHPDGLHMQIESQGSNLSAGQKQAVSLCRALLGQPALLLLDEPTVCLDQATENRLLQVLQQLDEKTTLVFTTHKLGLLGCATSLVLMNKGSIHLQGAKAQVLHEANTLAKALELHNRSAA